MPDFRESQDSAVLCDFLDLYLEDQAAGRRRSLAEYLRRFPGHEEHVAREFLALDGAGGKDGVRDAETGGGGDQLGHYRLLEKLGHGGQGTVFLAEDVRLRRHVAIKILDGSLGGLPATRLARLKREAEALSRLDHPRLCAVYDVDLSGERPYFAMRYVAGETLGQRIERARGATDPSAGTGGLLARMPQTADEIKRVVRFIEQAARAAHVAHEAGIIHRDLKPGNIMIDREEEPVVLDFGLARDLGGDGASITVSGDAFGTLSYMSPEQLSGERELDRRTDVYSLGVTLYECLTLRRPVEAATRESLLKGILTGEREDPLILNRALSRDLAVVIGCALDVDRSRRYATALAFAEDLRRLREHEPILARPAGWWTLTRRWAERHPAAFAGGLATFTLLVAGLIVTALLLARVTREQAQTKSEQAQTRLEQSKLQALRQAYLAQVLGNEKPALALRLGIESARRQRHPEINNILYDLLDRCYEKATYAIGGSPNWVNLGYEPLFDADGRLLVGYAGGIAAFDLATGSRSDLVSGRSQERGLNGPPHLAISKDSKVLGSIHEDGSLMIWDIGAPRPLRETRATGQVAPTWIEFSEDQRSLATGSSDGTVLVHDVGAGGPPARFELAERSITTARWDPTGSLLAVTGYLRASQAGSEAAVVWNTKTGQPVARLGPSGASGLWAAWSHSGARLAIAFDSTVKVFRASDWAEEASLGHGGRHRNPEPDADRVYWVAFHPDDRRLVTGSVDGVTVWDAATGKRIAAVGDFRERSVIRGAFSPDGSQLAVIAWDQTASIFSCDTWQEVRKLKGLGRPRGVVWSPDGSLLATTDEAETMHVWHPADRPHLPILRGHGDRVVSAVFHPDGRRALTASLDGNARVFDTGTGRLLHTMNHGKPLAAAKLSPEGCVLTIGGGRVLAWDGESGAALRELSHADARAVDAWPVLNKCVFVTYEDGTARLSSLTTGLVLRTFEGHRGPILSAAFHDGLAATGGSDRTIRVFGLESGKTIATLTFPGRDQPSGQDLSRVYALSFDKPGKRLIAGCQDLRLRVWDIESGRLEREDPAATPGMLALDPTGRWVMAGAKWLGRIWFLDLGDVTAPLRPAPFHDSHMTAALRFSPAGDYAMVASKDGTVRLWNMDTIRPHSVFDARCGILLDAAFSPDGGRVIVAGSDGTARIWPVDPLPVAERVCPVDDKGWGSMQAILEQALFSR